MSALVRSAVMQVTKVEGIPDEREVLELLSEAAPLRCTPLCPKTTTPRGSRVQLGALSGGAACVPATGSNHLVGSGAPTLGLESVAPLSAMSTTSPQ